MNNEESMRELERTIRENDSERLERVRELMRAWTALLDGECSVFDATKSEVLIGFVPAVTGLLLLHAERWATDPAYTDEAAWTELLRGWGDDD